MEINHLVTVLITALYEVVTKGSLTTTTSDALRTILRPAEVSGVPVAPAQTPIAEIPVEPDGTYAPIPEAYSGYNVPLVHTQGTMYGGIPEAYAVDSMTATQSFAPPAQSPTVRTQKGNYSGKVYKALAKCGKLYLKEKSFYKYHNCNLKESCACTVTMKGQGAPKGVKSVYRDDIKGWSLDIQTGNISEVPK